MPDIPGKEKIMRVMKIKDCKECPYFGTEAKQKEVDKNYKGYFYTINDDDQKYIQELVAYCLKKEKGYIVIIKNFGNEVYGLADDLARKMEKEIEEDPDKYREAKDKLYDDYIKRQKIDIPDWCPLEKKKGK